MSDEHMAYIALHSCGKLVMATMDTPELQKDNAKEIALCIKGGFTVERVPSQRVHELDWCNCDRSPKQPKGAE